MKSNPKAEFRHHMMTWSEKLKEVEITEKTQHFIHKINNFEFPNRERRETERDESDNRRREIEINILFVDLGCHFFLFFLLRPSLRPSN